MDSTGPSIAASAESPPKSPPKSFSEHHPSKLTKLKTFEIEHEDDDMGKSSKDKRDAYYRLAKEQNWRARSAFKLIQIDEQFDLFSHDDPKSCTRVVDLCAAPGSWSQVLSRILIKGQSFGRRAWIEKQNDFVRAVGGAKVEVEGDLSRLSLSDEPELRPRENVKIVAIDLQPMAPLEGIITLKADITHPATVPLLLKALDPDYDGSKETHRVDLVISDGAPDVTGLHDLDIYIQSQLLHSALALAMKVLRPGGKFVAKIFRGKNVDLIYAQLKLVFERVHVAKPRSSRASSLEAFVVCEGFRPISTSWTPEIGDTFGSSVASDKQPSQAPPPPPKRTDLGDGYTLLEFEDDETDIRRFVAPFVACGDLSAFDADATYKLPADYVSLPPVQPPTSAPYMGAIDRRRLEGGAMGKTKGKGEEKKDTEEGELVAEDQA